MSFAVGLCSAEANGWVLLFWWGLSFKFPGEFLVKTLHFYHWGVLVVVGCRWFSMLGKCFFY